MARRRPLDIRQILEWADSHFARTGHYPDVACGAIAEAPCEKWINIDGNLRRGGRGLPRGWSLARLMEELRGKRNFKNLPPHSTQNILAWADAHYACTGAWPRHESGPVLDAPGESWSAVDMALRAGTRGLRGGMSLARLLRKHRGVRRRRRRHELQKECYAHVPLKRDVSDSDHHVEAMWWEIERLRAGRNMQYLPPFTIEQILAWADEQFACNGDWPSPGDGLVAGTQGETWRAIEAALSHGLRGLPGDSTLARLLAEHRGVRNPQGLTPLTISQILTWADAHRERAGDWPTLASGPVAGTNGETWLCINHALRRGRRELPRGLSLAQLLDEHRGTHKAQNATPLTQALVLDWADAWRLRHGKWPSTNSGPIPESPRDNWNAIDVALSSGLRSLPGGTTVARLLADRRGKRNRGALPPVTEEQILFWADAYQMRHGKWPTQTSGQIEHAPGETWDQINKLLLDGRRGLPGGSSLPRLLAQRRGKRNRAALPPLSEEQMLAWADAYYARHGKWPSADSGQVSDAPGETWKAIDQALKQGYRALPGGSSLARLVSAHRGARQTRRPAPFSLSQVLQWADAWYLRQGSWPTTTSGAIPELPGKTWNAIAIAIRKGLREIPGGISLARLLADYRGNRNRAALPPLSEQQILAWADAHFARHDKWPGEKSGGVHEAPGETWDGINQCRRDRRRGLPGGSSLAKLLDGCRRKTPQTVGSAVAAGALMAPRSDVSECEQAEPAVIATRRKAATSNGRPVRIRPK